MRFEGTKLGSVFKRIVIGTAIASITFIFFLVAPLHAAPVAGRPGDLGAGVILGSPTGLALKYWFTESMAVDGALAWHFGDDDRFQFHADYLWHIPIPGLNVPNGRLPAYVGAGLRVLAGDHSEAGVRIPLGLSYLMSQVPIELFAEIVPIVKFAPDTDAELDGGVGIRYYFKVN